MSEVIQGHEAILKFAITMTRMASTPAGVELPMPPPCATEVECEYQELAVGKYLTAIVTAPAKYTNAFGAIQGGFLSGMIDNIMAPLSFLSAMAPTRSIDLSVNFLAAVRPADKLRIKAEVRKIGRTTLHMSADVFDVKDALVATATSNLQIMRP